MEQTGLDIIFQSNLNYINKLSFWCDHMRIFFYHRKETYFHLVTTDTQYIFFETGNFTDTQNIIVIIKEWDYLSIFD